MKTRAVLVAVALVFISAPVVAPDPPANSGPFVVRGEFDGADSDYWWGIADSKRGYVAIHGVDIVSWCEGTSPTGYNLWSFQDTNIPADEGLVHQLLKADDVLTSVWPISILDAAFFCDPLLEMGTPLAEGTIDMILTDNDVFAYLYDHNRANAWGITGHGVVTAPDGERMRLSSGFRCVWNTGQAGGDDPGAHCTEKVVLN